MFLFISDSFCFIDFIVDSSYLGSSCILIKNDLNKVMRTKYLLSF